MAKIQSVFNMGHPALKAPDGDWPHTDITAHRFDVDHVTVIIDGEDEGYAGDGWGLYLDLSITAARVLGTQLLRAASGQEPKSDTPNEADKT